MTHSEYPVLRKIFLQWIFVERIVLYTQVEKFYTEITEKVEFGQDNEDEKNIQTFLDYCRKSLNPISLNLKNQVFVQHKNKLEYIGICNVKSDCISQVATKLSAESISNFKKIILASKKSVNHELNIFGIEQDLNISRIQVQSLINELIENNWMIFNKSKGIYYLGPRTLLELDEYLKSPFDDLACNEAISDFVECQLCSSIISCGPNIKCVNLECNSIFHHYCIGVFSKTTGKSECPKCKTVF